jgi:trigger factor
MHGQLKVEIEKESYEETVENVLKDYQRTRNFHGFRKGKTPLGVIKKMFGKMVLEDELHKIALHEMLDFIRENNLHIIGDPLHDEGKDKIDFGLEKQEIVYDIAYEPEINTRLGKEDHVPFYTLLVDEKMIDEEVNKALARGGEMVSVEQVTNADLVKGEMVELNAGGTEKTGGLRVGNASLLVSRITDEATLEALAGATIGSRVVINLSRACPDKTDLAAMLDVKKEEAEEITSDFALTINDIKRYVPATPTKEFFDKNYGEGAVKSLEEFREKISEELSVQFRGYSDAHFTMDVRDKVLEKNPGIVLPNDFVKRWLVARRNQAALDLLESNNDVYRDEYIWQTARNAMVKEYDIQVTDEERKEVAISVANSHLQQYGIYNLSPGQLDEIAEKWLSNEDKAREFTKKGEDYKLFDHIKNSVTIDERKLPLEEFKSLFQRGK